MGPSSLPLSSSSVPRPPVSLPVREIPGSYGWPLLGPLSDRLDYFWFQGPELFFRHRMQKLKSTVFRTNMPPTFPLFQDVNPNVISVLDCKSFANLFDMEVVEKKNILVGDFMPSVKFTGDIRVCVYLDTSEPQHSKVKSFAMDIIKRSSKTMVSELTSSLSNMWDTIETNVSKHGSAEYLIPLQQLIFRFLSKVLIGADPSTSPEIEKSGYSILDRWLALMLLPTIKIGVFQPLEEIFLHSFAYPFALISGGYKKLHAFVEQEGQETINRGEAEFGLSREETIQNLLFLMGFNAFGGFSVFLPTLINKIITDKELQKELVREVREKMKEKNESALSMNSVKEMKLLQSVVFETLRLNPPVPLQFARARKDFQLISHDAVYNIEKGELLCGYQPLVMRDPLVFDEPETFKPDRFMGANGRELLNYVFWSNGPETGSPSVSNKQCPAKDLVPLTACLFLAYIFQRYDSITGSSGSITAVEKATDLNQIKGRERNVPISVQSKKEISM